jgi:hypothetical protein
MKVRCIRNRIEELPNENIRNWLKKSHLRLDEDCPIEFNKMQEYVVYGIVFCDSHPFYFLCDEKDAEYPTPNYAGFFDVLDDRISKFWRLDYKSNDNGDAWTFLIHKDWASDPMFYENLIDGNETEVKLFQKYKKEMDDEADS